MRFAAVAFVTIAALGCEGGEAETNVETPPTACAAGEWPGEEGCVPAGLPPGMPCPPAEWLRDDGSCIPAGVPPDGCGQGFAHDGDRGCEPILPREPCPLGLMAALGERQCREVAPCVPGRWGDIPVQPDTEHVDGSYTASDSDGSALRPWPSIQAGVDAASPGAIVAIAAGSYLEDVIVSGKAVRLWGVCPALVEVVGSGTDVASVAVHTGARGTAVRKLALRGARNGFGLSGSVDVLLEQVWVHDNARRGVIVENAFGATAITLRSSLVEQNHEVGLFVASSEATVETSVVRDTAPNAQGVAGRGVSVEIHPMTLTSPALVLRSSIVERNHDVGVFVAGASATLEGSLIRDIEGRGLVAIAHPTTAAPTSLVVGSSLIERSSMTGVFVGGSEATLEASVVRDTQPDDEGNGGRGINAQRDDTTHGPSTLVVLASLVENNHEIGVFAAGSHATVDASAVRDTLPRTDGLYGSGVYTQPDPASGGPSTLVVRTSLVERNHMTGVHVSGSQGEVSASIVRDTQPDLLGFFGRGVHVQPSPSATLPPTLTVHASLVERNTEAGIAVVGADTSIDACLVRDSRPSAAQGTGEGVMVMSESIFANATITATRIENSALAAVAAWGAHAGIGGSVLACQAFDLNSESFAGYAAELVDLGGNLCGCPDPVGSCKAMSAGLEPPPPLDPL